MCQFSKVIGAIDCIHITISGYNLPVKILEKNSAKE